MECRHCGFANDVGDKFCGKCGELLVEATINPVSEQALDEKTSTGYRIKLAIIVLVLTVLADSVITITPINGIPLFMWEDADLWYILMSIAILVIALPSGISLRYIAVTNSSKGFLDFFLILIAAFVGFMLVEYGVLKYYMLELDSIALLVVDFGIAALIIGLIAWGVSRVSFR
jgi:hypothetical protein